MEIGVVIAKNAYLYERLEDLYRFDSYSGIADEIFMGWAVGILEDGIDYVKAITHYGYQGYMRKELLREWNREMLRCRDQAKNTCFICRSEADIMNQPSVRGQILNSLSRGSFVLVLQEDVEAGYQKVILADGIEGFVPKKALSQRMDSDGYLYTQGAEDYFLYQKLVKEIPSDILRQRIANQAIKYLGTQYRWGCKSGTGLDCSGMTFMSYQMCGILIYRDAKIVPEYPVHKIPFEEVKKGDLLFFPGHVAMYLEYGKYIHTTGYASSFGCVINSLCETEGDYRKDLAEQILCAGSVFY